MLFREFQSFRVEVEELLFITEDYSDSAIQLLPHATVFQFVLSCSQV